MKKHILIIKLGVIAVMFTVGVFVYQGTRVVPVAQIKATTNVLEKPTASSTLSSGQLSNEGWKVYENPEFGYRLKYPEGHLRIMPYSKLLPPNSNDIDIVVSTSSPSEWADASFHNEKFISNPQHLDIGRWMASGGTNKYSLYNEFTGLKYNYRKEFRGVSALVGCRPSRYSDVGDVTSLYLLHPLKIDEYISILISTATSSVPCAIARGLPLEEQSTSTRVVKAILDSIEFFQPVSSTTATTSAK